MLLSMKNRLFLLCMLCFLGLQVYAQTNVQIVGGANTACVGTPVTYRLIGTTATNWIVGGYHTELQTGQNSIRFTWLAPPPPATAPYSAYVEAMYNGVGSPAYTGSFLVYDYVTPHVTAAPTSVTINYTTPVIFSVTSTDGGGTAPSYQWYLNNNPVTGANGLSFNTQTFGITLQNNDQVFVKMTSNATCASPGYNDSDVIPLTVNYPLSKPTVSDVFVMFNGAVPLMASGAGSDEVYQWYDSPSAENFLYQGISYTISNVVNHKTYYVSKFNTTTKIGSERVPQVVTVIVPEPVVPTASTNTCAEKTLSYIGTPPPGITWYWQGTDVNGQETGIVASASTYTVAEATAQMYYLRARSNTNIWSNAVGTEVTTDPVDITVSTYQEQNALVTATHSITFGSGFVVPEGSKFQAEITISDECNDRYNWSEQLAFGENGATISRGRVYSDGLGNLLQNQSIDVASGKVWLSQPLYDNLSTPAAGTLPAPIQENDFLFKKKFVTSV